MIAPSSSPLVVEADPLDVLAAWPQDRPVLMLHSGRVHPRWARWSILAPPSGWFRFDDGRSTLSSARGDSVSRCHDPLRDLDAVLRSTAQAHRPQRPAAPSKSGHGGPRAAPGIALPFAGGWIGHLSYELGGWIEPLARSRGIASKDAGRCPWPLIELAYCPVALVFDHVQKSWRMVGEGDAGVQEELAAILQRADSIRRSCDDSAASGFSPGFPGFSLGELTSRVSRAEHARSIQQALEYIAAGDIYQANITQRFCCDFAGSPRGLAIEALRRAQPWYGAYLESAHTMGERLESRGAGSGRAALISLSPELFLDVDASARRVTTRPIKGTRPAARPVLELIESTKDAAELHMIVDLMRNDLGRVCQYGSVQVIEPRMIETHPTVHQGVGEITGRLREGVSATDLLRATFPGGSVTGVPKIRAMQVIDELEPGERGPYCGAIGYFSDCGRWTLSIAIRTMMLRGWAAGVAGPRAANDRDHDRAASIEGAIEYSAGGGIVADSKADQEYEECLVKCRVLRDLIDSSREPAASPAR